MKTNNFKMRCIEEFGDCTTKGKIYEVKDGQWTYDNGEVTYTNSQTVEDINSQYISQFESVEEEPKASKVNDILVKLEVSVDKVSDDGIVTILINGQPTDLHIDINKLNKKINEEKIIEKRKWTDWIESNDGTFSYKTNYKKVKVNKNGIVSKATCHENDKFILQDGINLCLSRINIKEAEKRIDWAKSKLKESEMDLQCYKAGLESLLYNL